jgi:phage recombination protein Bet
MSTDTKAPTTDAAEALRKAVEPAPMPPVHVPKPAPSREGMLGMMLTEQQIELLKSVMVGATDDEVAIFAHVCNRTGLDPFARQIYPVKRRTQVDGQWVERWVFQVSIDGFRLIAHRTHLYDGQLEPVFYDPGENERTIWLDTKPPVACKVGVRRKGVAEPLFATVLWREYVQTTQQGGPTKMWRDKPTVMLAKCAEAAALRKAFPQELSGLYVHEELMRDDPTDEVPPPKPIAQARAKVAEAAAEILNDGDVTLNFGRFANRKASTLTLEECEKTFIPAWQDPARKKTAEERMGKAAVQFILEHHAKLKAAPPPAPEPVEVPAWVLRIIEAKLAGTTIAIDAAEDFRQWMLDNPEPAARITERLNAGAAPAKE